MLEIDRCFQAIRLGSRRIDREKKPRDADFPIFKRRCAAMVETVQVESDFGMRLVDDTALKIMLPIWFDWPHPIGGFSSGHPEVIRQQDIFERMRREQPVVRKMQAAAAAGNVVSDVDARTYLTEPVSKIEVVPT